jgi:hypothetical protein
MKKADEEETICQSALVVFRSSICILTRLNILSIFLPRGGITSP